MTSLSTELMEVRAVSTSKFDKDFIVLHLGMIEETFLVPYLALECNRLDGKLEVLLFNVGI
jgi:hypothetical protein